MPNFCKHVPEWICNKTL